MPKDRRRRLHVEAAAAGSTLLPKAGRLFGDLTVWSVLR
jgi:hypothetical protein